MGWFDQHIAHFRNIESNLNAIILDIVRDYEAEILDMNTERLATKGTTNKAQKIVPEYRPLTVQIKRIKGQRTDIVTLKDTGDFHSSFFVIYGRDYFAVYANDDKTEALERKYGNDIWNLDPEQGQQLIDWVKNDFILVLKKPFIQ